MVHALTGPLHDMNNMMICLLYKKRKEVKKCLLPSPTVLFSFIGWVSHFEWREKITLFNNDGWWGAISSKDIDV